LDLFQKKRFQDAVKLSSLDSPHLWICSSGSSSLGTNLIALSREALWASAIAVNKHLKVNSADRWLNVLPIFHVGGFGVIARALISQSEVIHDKEKKWDPLTFVNQIQSNRVTISSLVPTQVFDLVKESLKCPTSMRALVVGGGAISDSLLNDAVKLGWPLLKSYGMTECCSQVATSPIVECGKVCGPPIKLSHIDWIVNAYGNLAIRSPSLLSGYFQFNSDLSSVEWKDPRTNGWYHTHDKVEIQNDILTFNGRDDQVVKVKGELVNLQNLNQKWIELIRLNQIDPQSSLILDLPDSRAMNSIHLIVEVKVKKDLPVLMDKSIAKLVDKFNQQVLPFERITEIHCIDEIPRTSLSKVQMSVLRNTIRR
jgi:O-succinylbenzoic acid--CoA ligase